jgi:hypothetical protein
MYRPNFTADEVLFPNSNLKAVGLAGHVRNIAAGEVRRLAN